MRRWWLTSAAAVDSAADQRSAGWACWGGNAAGLGGWTFVTRVSLTTLQATGMAFFGLYGSTAAPATTLTLATAINCIGIGFQRGTHTRWQLVANDGTGAPTMTDMGASFAIATGGVLTLYIAAPPNGGSVWVRVVDEVSGAVFEQENTDRPACQHAVPVTPAVHEQWGHGGRESPMSALGSTWRRTSEGNNVHQPRKGAQLCETQAAG